MAEIKNIPILMYHHVLEKAEIPAERWNELYVDISDFSAQMAYLKKSGFTSIDFEELNGIINGGKSPPKRPVIITFDDGYERTFSKVCPVLKEKGFKAVFAVVTGDVSGMNTWDENIADLPELKVMNKDMIVLGAKEGFVFESHSVTHAHLHGRPFDKIKNELKESKKHLEEMTGKNVTTIIYPYGECDDNVIRAAKETGYIFGCAISSPTGSVIEDNYRLKRVFVKGSDTLGAFKRKISAWNMWYRGIRKR